MSDKSELLKRLDSISFTMEKYRWRCTDETLAFILLSPEALRDGSRAMEGGENKSVARRRGRFGGLGAVSSRGATLA